MVDCYTPLPTASISSDKALPMPSDAPPRREPWDTPTLSSAGFLRVGSVVPRTAPVLLFGEDGTASGLVPDPTVAAPDLVAWARKVLSRIPGYQHLPWPGPHSGNCGVTWPAEHGGVWLCTLPDGHSGDVRHEAQGVKGAVLASPTEALVTEAITPARKAVA